ncbi:hypothetical protein Hanom_Chr01g00062091 [Helianthus anomalus]
MFKIIARYSLPSTNTRYKSSVSIKKSSRVASAFNCRLRDANVFWHSANLLPAIANSFSCKCRIKRVHL